MKSIFTFVGSCKETASNTYKYTKVILDKVSAMRSVKSTIVFPTSIKLCNKCSSCFSNGVCTIDDDMEKLKKDMLAADVIILGSGVYFQQISSEMKNFIDRLSYWAHTFEMLGKQCVIVTTSGSNGNNIAEVYLKRVAASLGMQIIGTTFCHTLYPEELNMPEILSERAKVIIDVIISAIDGKTPKHSLPFQEQLFLSMKKIYSEHSEFVLERMIWQQRGYFKVSSFEELLDKA